MQRRWDWGPRRVTHPRNNLFTRELSVDPCAHTNSLRALNACAFNYTQPWPVKSLRSIPSISRPDVIYKIHPCVMLHHSQRRVSLVHFPTSLTAIVPPRLWGIVRKKTIRYRFMASGLTELANWVGHCENCLALTKMSSLLCSNF